MHGTEERYKYLKFKVLTGVIESLLLFMECLERICGQLLESAWNVLNDGR